MSDDEDEMQCSQEEEEEEEDYGFDYEDASDDEELDDDADPRIAAENRYYAAKGLAGEDPREALALFREVVDLEPEKQEWCAPRARGAPWPLSTVAV